MKMILTWDKNKSQYNIRYATKEEIAYLNEIHELINNIKKFYYDVIRDAANANQSIDIFIDNECYCSWQNSLKDAKRVNSLAEKLDIAFDIDKYIHWI